MSIGFMNDIWSISLMNRHEDKACDVNAWQRDVILHNKPILLLFMPVDVQVLLDSTNQRQLLQITDKNLYYIQVRQNLFTVCWLFFPFSTFLFQNTLSSTLVCNRKKILNIFVQICILYSNWIAWSNIHNKMIDWLNVA